jgi:hypothetical protein
VLAAAAAAAAVGSSRLLRPFMTESATAHAAIAADARGVQPADSARRQANCPRATAAEAGRGGEWPQLLSPSPSAPSASAPSAPSAAAAEAVPASSAPASSAAASSAAASSAGDLASRQAKCSRTTAEAGRRGEWPQLHSPLGRLATLVTALWGRMACLTLKPAPGVRVLVTRRPARESSSPGTWLGLGLGLGLGLRFRV